jgi:hypothetical protein
MGTLTLKMTKVFDKTIISEYVLNVNVSNPDIIMTSETNPEVMKILYESGISNNEHYLLKSEAALITDDDLYPSVNNSVFKSKKSIVTFNEFKYFTGVTKVGAYSFSECTNLKSITLPRSIKRIESYAFSNTDIRSIEIPVNVDFIDQSAFDGNENLTSISVGLGNVTYLAENNCIYTNAGSTLYIIAPGLKEYVMRDETQKLYNPDMIFRFASDLTKITINSSIQFNGI